MQTSSSKALLAFILAFLATSTSAQLSCHEYQPNCALCDSANTLCKVCKPGYYLLKLDSASSLSSAICVSDCAKFGTHKPNIITRECELDCDEACTDGICGSDKTTCADLTKSSQCPEWSFLLPSEECSLFGCPSGFYRDGAQRKCKSCHSSCQECVGASSEQCTRCDTSKVLSLNQSSESEGICKLKEIDKTAYRLFVTNDISVIQNGKPNSQRDGSVTNPFIDIRDALSRALELAGPVRNAEVTIFLTKGDHYVLLEKETDRYRPYTPRTDETFQLTIKPLPCGQEIQLDRFCVAPETKVNLRVKIGAYFVIPSPRALTIQNISFDYADSLLEWGSPCQSARAQACEISVSFDDKVQVYSLNQACSCLNVARTADQCNANHPLALFNLQQTRTSETVKKLKLQGATFTNIFTHYNSLIGFDGVSGLGAQIEITKSSFSQISMCGAVINSFIKAPSNKNFPYPILSDFLAPPAVIVNQDPFIKPAIAITDSQFSKIGLALIYNQDIHLYQTEYRDLRFESVGHVLNIGSFPGEITIQNNLFDQNKLNFDFIKTIDATERIEYETSLVKSKFGLIKQGVISIQDHAAGLKLIGNTFTRNSGLRGPVLVEVPSVYTKGVFILNNVFQHNTGWVRSNALNLRTVWTPEADLSCSGFYLQGNQFIQNSNLPRQVGQIYLGCIPFDFVQSDGIDDINGSQFLHSHKLLDPLFPQPLEEQIQLVDGTTRLVDYTNTVFKDNVFSQNFRGRGQGNLIIVMFMQRVLVDGLQLLRNGDISIMEEFKKAEQFWLDRSGLHASQVINNYDLQFSRLEREVHPLLGDQLLFMGKINNLKIQKVNAIENWFWEGFVGFTHFLSLIDCKTEIEDLKIAKLIKGRNQTLFDYTLKDHNYLDSAEILSDNDWLTLLQGRLIYGSSFNLTNAYLTSFNISGALIHPVAQTSFIIDNMNFYNAQVHNLVQTFEVDEVIVRNSNFTNFVFNFTAIKADTVTIQNSLFNNENFFPRGPIGLRLQQVFVRQQLYIKNSRFIQVCAQSLCERDFILSIHTLNYVELTNTTIERYAGSQQFQIASMLGGTIVIKENCYFINNTGINAGVFTFKQNTLVLISDSYFIDNFGKTAGVFELQGSTQIKVTDSLFQRNKAATTAGIVSFTGASQFTFSSCEFIGNEAGEYGSIAQGVSDGITLQTFKKCTFKENKGQNTMSIFQANLLVDEAQYEGNFDYDGSSAPLYFIASSAKIQGSTFTNRNYGGSECQDGIQGFGGFVFGMSDNDIQITNTIFEKVCALKGGAVFLGVFSKFKASQVEFNNCRSKERGGAIYATNSADCLIQDTNFQNNLAPLGAADIFLQDTAGMFEVKNSKFKFSGSSSIFAERSSLTIKSSNFEKIYLDSPKQSIVTCEFCLELKVEQNEFKNLEGRAALSVEYFNQIEGEELKTFEIVQNTFQSIKGREAGGAVYLKDPPTSRVSQNSFFEVTTVSESSASQGGALFVSQGEKQYPCSIQSNRFTACKAEEGGALFWDQYEPSFDNNTFVNNEATRYAKNVGSYPRTLKFISERDGENFISGGISTQAIITKDQINLGNMQTGRVLPVLYVAALDKYNQIVTSVNNGTVYLLARQILQDGEEPSTFKALLSNENTNLWTNGVMKLDNLKLNGEPGRDYEIIIRSPKINKDLPDTQVYLEENNIEDITLRLTIQFRLCQSGEKFVSDGACVKCPFNTYLIEAPRSPQECLECPENAICYGGNQIGPLPGFWRSNFQSTNFVPCLYEGGCNEAKDGEDYIPEGKCAFGYFGTLCGSCETGYTRNSQYKCSSCPPIGANIAILIVITLFIGVGFVFLIKLSLKSQKQKKSIFTVYFKIMMSHLQLLMLISTFDLEWPNEVHTIFNSSRSVTDAPQELFSFDCFLQTSVGRPIKRYYLYLLIYFLLPIFIAATTIAFWRLKLWSRTHLISGRIISTLLICFFLVHPSVSKVILGTFNCITIDDQQFMVEELSEQCWRSSHLSFALTLGLFGILLWTLGIPLYSGYLLRKNKETLNENETKEKFGFLYNGYNPGSYYWEVVIQLRKVLIAFVSIFLTSRGTIVQSLVLLCILAFFIFVTLRVAPFQDRHANYLEIVSLIALIITTYCGVFYLSSRNPSRNGYVFGKDYYLSEFHKWILFLAILFSNGIFLFLWIIRLVKGIRSTMIKKLPRCFFCCCACFNRRKMMRQIELDKKYQKNSELIKEINQICNSLTGYGNRLERAYTTVEENMVYDLANTVKNHINQIQQFRSDTFKSIKSGSILGQPTNKVKRISSKKLPTHELQQQETNRSEVPSTRRHMNALSRDSKDFLVSGIGPRFFGSTHTNMKSAWADENLTSEGNQMTTEGPILKSKFNKVQPSLTEILKRHEENTYSMDERLQSQADPPSPNMSRFIPPSKKPEVKELNFWEG